MGVLLERTTQTEADNTGSWKTGRKMGKWDTVEFFFSLRRQESMKPKRKKNNMEANRSCEM